MVWMWSFDGKNTQKGKLKLPFGAVENNMFVENKVKYVNGPVFIQSALNLKNLNISDNNSLKLANEFSKNETIEKQFFKIRPIGYKKEFIIESSGKVLQANPKGKQVTMVEGRFDSNTYDNSQLWYFEEAGNGLFYIKSKTGNYLNVLSRGKGDGAIVEVWNFNKSDAQKWKLKPLEKSGQFSDYALDISFKTGGDDLRGGRIDVLILFFEKDNNGGGRVVGWERFKNINRKGKFEDWSVNKIRLYPKHSFSYLHHIYISTSLNKGDGLFSLPDKWKLNGVKIDAINHYPKESTFFTKTFGSFENIETPIIQFVSPLRKPTGYFEFSTPILFSIGEDFFRRVGERENMFNKNY